jgi:small subunit ribosomal protein S17
MTDEKAAAPAATAPKGPTAPNEEKSMRRQELVGVVTSAKMHKTIVVKVVRTTQHPLYVRVIRSSKKYYAHDENGEARQGDTVRIVASRPLSKLKRWQLLEVVARTTRVV